MTTAAYIAIGIAVAVWIVVVIIEAWQDPWGRP